MTKINDKRVTFDFEIDFSNGGGIQGQGFRLDIDGENIEDKKLADYIVKDMRLLMVGEVRILNKQIIEEKHKRKQLSKETTCINVSHTVEDGLITQQESNQLQWDYIQKLAETNPLQ